MNNYKLNIVYGAEQWIHCIWSHGIAISKSTPM